MSGLVWGAAAQRDLRGILGYHLQFGPDVPQRLISAVEQAAQQLVDHPKLGPQLPDSKVRIWRARTTPFIILYRPVGNTVRILQVRHAASNWKPIA